MKVNVQLNNSSKTGRFADVKLTIVDTQGAHHTVGLYIDFQQLKDFSNDTKSVAFDFFFVSCLIYGIDNMLKRHQYSIDGWAREVEVSIPVNNLTVWSNCQEQFNTLLTFLTGDYWDVSFYQVSNIDFFTDKAKRWAKNRASYDKSKYTFASLFSGGLDSLVGVIDGLSDLQDGSKALWLSHFDSSSPGANRDQEQIVGYCYNVAAINGKFDWVQTVVALSNTDKNGVRWDKEPSFRSRSLLFMGIAILCVEGLPNCNTLTIPENGTISLNYPLTPSRSSTLSTRTTHPHYLQKLQDLISHLGLSTILVNPYQFKTKGELIEDCKDQDLLRSTYPLSVSCGKRGRKMYWDTKSGTHHCGVCMPCIYRRAALNKVGWDNQLYGIDLFTTPNAIYDKYDFPALFNFLDNRITTEKIKRTLLISGALPQEDITDYVSLVMRVRREIKDWITAKGNKTLKLAAHT